MSWLLPAIIATLSNTALLALVYLYLYLKENETSLLLFSISWGIYSLRFVAMLLYIYYDRAALLLLNQTFIIISSHLLFVAFNIWLKKKPSPPVFNICTALALLWVLMMGFFGLSFTLYSIPIFFYVGFLYIAIAIVLLRSKWSSLAGIKIVSITLVIWGIHKVDYPFLRPLEWFAPWGYLLGAFAALITAIGMVLIYFETAKRQLKLLLGEKESLIKEIHHRVKNNLSVLHSLINHSLASTDDPGLQEILKKLEDKIFAFVLIHSMLHKSESVEQIDFKEYVHKFSKHLVQSYEESEEILLVTVVPEQLFIDIDMAKSLGLIINELLTNALKHAFTDSDKKHIDIHITDANIGNYALRIHDNGNGFPDHLDIDSPKMSGIYLVRMLCEEIGGDMKINNEVGTEVIIHFPKSTQESE